jgi:cyclopropane-fatty-acyl-phospholipid synthase
MDLLSPFAKRALLARLNGLEQGRLVLRDGADVHAWGDPDDRSIELTVLDQRFYSAVAFGGSVGAGEAYADGWWTTDNLTGLVRLMVRNRSLLDGLETGLARLAQPARRLLHAFNRNTKRGAKRNISAHYDLSNEFFQTFLDDTLTYSSGLFLRPGASLKDASIAKYDRIAALLDLRSTDHVVEIGTGWGGFAIHVASKYGCRVTTTTISEEQFALASQRVAAAGLSDRITLLKQDYRDLTGQYDKLASIEMIEAVGHDHYAAFFAKCKALLTPKGRAVIQAITIADERYESARREVDFIKRHIFPGSCIPSRTVLRNFAKGAGLDMIQADEMGLHYAETLRRWRHNLQAQKLRVEQLGFDERFQRLWEFYFSYCEGGFLERAIGTAQIVFAPPSAGLTAPLPAPYIGTVPTVNAAA